MIQTTVPAWFWLVAVAVAAGYAGALYYRSRKDELSKGWKIGLAAVRFLFVFLICFLLMSPIAKMKQEQVQKPLCFVAVDDSRSMRAALNPEYRNRQEADTTAFIASGFAQEVEEQTNRLCEELSERFQVQRLAFGKEVRQEKSAEAQESDHPSYAQEATDYARLFPDMAQRLSASTVSKAVAILISDGQANIGQEPVSAYRHCPFPLYCLPGHLHRGMPLQPIYVFGQPFSAANPARPAAGFQCPIGSPPLRRGQDIDRTGSGFVAA